MKNIAFIPTRKGSKGIPGKAWKKLKGKPLVCYAIEAALNCDYIDTLCFSTDSIEVKEIVETYQSSGKRIIFHERHPDQYDDKAKLDPILVDFAIKNQFETLCLLQVTNPFTTGEVLNNSYSEFLKQGNGYQSLLSVVEQKRFIWMNDYIYTKDSVTISNKPLNYLVWDRPNRDKIKLYFIENGAFYIMTHSNLLRYQSRLTIENIGIFVMPDYSYFELDSETDWAIVDKLMELVVK